MRGVRVGCRWQTRTALDDPRFDESAHARAVAGRLVAHLRERTDVQNVDVMNLAGFCRNCLSKWYRAAAVERGIELSDEAAVMIEPAAVGVHAACKARVEPGATVVVMGSGTMGLVTVAALRSACGR